MNCKHCCQGNATKAGHIRGHQRYKEDARGILQTHHHVANSESVKAFAVYMYTLCNASFGMIGRTFGVSNVAVLKWVRNVVTKLDCTRVDAQSTVILVDEMWHFVDGKKTKFGSGKPFILCQNVLSNGSLVAAMIERSNDC